MRYKIILSNSKETIVVREDELEKVMKGIRKGGVVVCREGVVNPAYLVAIIPDFERTEAIERYNYREDSPFSKLLGPEMKMLKGKKQPLY